LSPRLRKDVPVRRPRILVSVSLAVVLVRNRTRAMADVIFLPTAAAAPLPRRRWHGRYPKGVTPISIQRARKLQACRAAAANESVQGKKQPYGMAEALLKLYHRAMQDDIAGVVMVVEADDGGQSTLICGEFAADSSRAREAAGRLCEVLDGLDD
jgi:hypothetical protein